MRHRLASLVLLCSLLLAVVLGAVLADAGVAASLGGRLADNQQQQGAVRDDIASAESEAQSLGQQIEEYGRQAESLRGPIAELDAELERTATRIAAGRTRVAQLRRGARVLDRRVARTDQRLDTAHRRLVTRLVDAYMNGEIPAGVWLTDVRSIDDVLSRSDAISRISDADDALVTEVARLRRLVGDQRREHAAMQRSVEREVATLRREERELEAREQELVERQQELAAVIAERDGLQDSAESRERVLRGELEGLEEQSTRIEDAIQAAAVIPPPVVAPEPEPEPEPEPDPELEPAPEAAPEAAPSGSADSGQSSASTSTGPAPTAPSAPAPSSSSGLVWPVGGPVVSPFGPRWGRAHEGIDISASSGTPIRAAASGTVIHAGWMDGYGNLVIIQHGGGLATAYAHQSSIATGVGSSVGQGQTIGYVGCTGSCYGDHLHFETRQNGSAVDPMPYL